MIVNIFVGAEFISFDFNRIVPLRSMFQEATSRWVIIILRTNIVDRYMSDSGMDVAMRSVIASISKVIDSIGEIQRGRRMYT